MLHTPHCLVEHLALISVRIVAALINVGNCMCFGRFHRFHSTHTARYIKMFLFIKESYLGISIVKVLWARFAFCFLPICLSDDIALKHSYDSDVVPNMA